MTIAPMSCSAVPAVCMALSDHQRLVGSRKARPNWPPPSCWPSRMAARCRRKAVSIIGVTHIVLVLGYVASAALEIVGLRQVFNPEPVDRHDGTIEWANRRTGAWLIGIGIAVGLGGNIAALYVH